MDRLNGLIKMQKWQVDEKRRAISDLEGARLQLISQISGLDADYEKEKRLMATQTIPVNFQAFSAHYKERRANIEKSISEYDASIEVARDELSVLFQELKQYETVVERRKQREKDRLKKIEQAELDEIGLNIHRKKQVEAKRQARS